MTSALVVNMRRVYLYWPASLPPTPSAILFKIKSICKRASSTSATSSSPASLMDLLAGTGGTVGDTTSSISGVESNSTISGCTSALGITTPLIDSIKSSSSVSSSSVVLENQLPTTSRYTPLLPTEITIIKQACQEFLSNEANGVHSHGGGKGDVDGDAGELLITILSRLGRPLTDKHKILYHIYKYTRTTNNNTGRWSEQEFSLLKNAVKMYGFREAELISQIVTTRTPAQIRNKIIKEYYAKLPASSLSPSPSSSSDNMAISNHPSCPTAKSSAAWHWTIEERDRLKQAVAMYKGATKKTTWRDIAKHVQTRSPESCKQYYLM